MKLVSESLQEFLFESQIKFKLGKNFKDSIRIGLDSIIRNFIQDENPYKNSWSKRDPLWVCVKYNKIKFVDYLIKKGVDVHVNDDAALRWACGLGFKEIVALLLDAGADPDVEGPGGKLECYTWADRNRHYDIIDLLDRSKDGEKFFTEESQEEVKEVPPIVRPELPQLETPDEKEEENNWI